MQKQQCYLVMIWASWATYLGAFAWFLATGELWLAAGWLLLLPLAQWIYVLNFPRISHLMGYGSVDDEPATEADPTAAEVTLYTALACPFCPLVEQRLEALQETMGFELRKVDVTLRADTLVSKGIRSVPVVEAGDRRITGNATSRELAELIAGESPAGMVRRQSRADTDDPSAGAGWRRSPRRIPGRG